MSTRPILLRDRPIMKRRMTIGGPRPLPLHAVEQIKQRNFFENLGNTDGMVTRRPPVNDDMMYRELGNQRGWNGFNSGGQFNLNTSAPPPPENLIWENPQSFQRERSPPVRRALFEVPDEEPVQNIQEPYYRRTQEPPSNAYGFPEGPSVFNNRNEDFERREFSNANFENNGQHLNQRGDEDFERREFCNGNFGNNGQPEHNRNDDFERREFFNKNFGNNGQSVNQPEPTSGGTEPSDKIFMIAGFKLPFLTNEMAKSAFVESRSYAVRYFQKTPNYIIRKKKTKDAPIIQHIYNEIEDVHYDDYNDQKSTALSINRHRESLCKEWTKIYRGRNYRSWDGWWKDFHNIDVDIFEQLAKFECFNVKYNFMSPGGVHNADQLINRANIALTKNRNNYVGNLKVAHSLMDHTVLGNLAMEETARLQDIIRSVPNHLWVYKLRCMIYVWYNYGQVMKSKDTQDKKYQIVLKEWRSPVIHWLAKQAFFELKSISKLEYPQFREVYGAARQKAKK
ncbi:uncharacterized protein [Drosophila takahashii]|uniref:uncharacterized protein n=1 Tax=Drosophila takahashii TaxID=29030 RepID=UPI0038990E1F